MLLDLGNSYSLKISGAAPGRMLANLITSLNKKHNQRVVLLIDEYDAPVSDNLHDFDLARVNRDILKNFYSNLKSCDKYLRFVFVTGVTRYAFMGLSAGLNQLIDLTLDKEYSDICGFTHDEFKSCFAEHFSKALNEVKKSNILPFKATVSDLQKKILDMYDGYSWDGVTKVLNPFSLLCFFRNFKFNAFWMNQDPSAKLISALVAKDPLAFTDDKLRELSVKQIGVAEVGSLAPVSALFQTGYLTVNKVTNSSKGYSLYDFRIPNEEIKPEFESIFSKGLYTVLKKEPEIEKRTFKNAVQLGEAEKVSLMFRSLLASLPSRHHRSEESFYHSVLFGYFYNMPDTILTLPEQPGAIGIPDLVVIFDDGLYVVVELKYQKEGDTELTEENFKTTLTSLAEEGLKAIEKKHYLWPYLNRAKKIVKMGVGIYGRDQVLVLMEN
jgi:hypothetical protein